MQEFETALHEAEIEAFLHQRGEIHKSLIHILEHRTPSVTMAMIALADTLGLFIAATTMNNRKGRPVLLDIFITCLKDRVERYGKVNLNKSRTLH